MAIKRNEQIDVDKGGYYHLVVYSNPKACQSWSDLKVANKLLKVFPGKLNNPKFKRKRLAIDTLYFR